MILGIGSPVSSAPLAVELAFDVGWGAWDGGTNIVDIKGSASPHIIEPVYWLSASHEDVADLTGVFTYGSYDMYSYSPDQLLGFLGETNDGMLITPLNEVGMSFDVNFNSGNITNGLFEAADTAGNRLFTEFTGTTHGAVGNINDFSNATFGTDTDYSLNAATSVTGEIRGIFTASGPSHGFATGFSLSETSGTSFNGVGIIDGRTPLVGP